MIDNVPLLKSILIDYALERFQAQSLMKEHCYKKPEDVILSFNPLVAHQGPLFVDKSEQIGGPDCSIILNSWKSQTVQIIQHARIGGLLSLEILLA